MEELCSVLVSALDVMWLFHVSDLKSNWWRHFKKLFWFLTT